jgi:Leucine-rich repeat (LRR) protein
MTAGPIKTIVWLLVRLAALFGLLLWLATWADGPAADLAHRFEYLGAAIHVDESSVVTGIELSDEHLEPDLIADLGKLSTLKSILVRNAYIEDSLIEQIGKLPQLDTVCLTNCELTVDHLKALSELPLKCISLARSKNDKLSLRFLTRLTNLDRLDVSGCDWIDDEETKFLSAFPELRTADFSGTAITDIGVSQLCQCAHLHHINITGCLRVTEDGFRELSRCPKMRILVVREIPLNLAAIDTVQRSRADIILQFSQHLAPDLQAFLATGKPLPSIPGPRSGSSVSTTIFRSGLASTVAAKFDSPTDFRVLGYLPQLTSLRLSGAGVTDDVLAHIPAMTELQILEITNSQLSPGAVARLPRMPELTTVSLLGNTIDSHTLHWLSKLPRLRRLDISSVTYVPESVPLKSWRIRMLNALDLRHSDRATAILQSLQTERLESLNVADCQLNDEDLSVLQKFPGLRDLVLSENPLTGSGLKALQNQLLSHLDLSGSSVTDSGLSCLSQRDFLPGSLDVSNTQITGEFLHECRDGVRELRVNGSRFAEENLKALVNFSSLDFLDLRGVPIGGEELSQLVECPRLAGLGFTETGDVLSTLASTGMARQLRYLAIRGADRESLSSFPEFRHVQGALLELCELDEELARDIVNQTVCDNLTLDACRMSEKTVQVFAGIEGFFSLKLLRMSPVSAESVRYIQRNPGFHFVQDNP